VIRHPRAKLLSSRHVTYHAREKITDFGKKAEIPWISANPCLLSGIVLMLHNTRLGFPINPSSRFALLDPESIT